MPRRRAHGQGTLILRGNTWHLRLRHQGRILKRSLQTSDRDEAELRAQALAIALHSRSDSPTTSYCTAAAREVDRIETDTSPGQAERARHAFTAFYRFAQTDDLESIDAPLLERYQRHRLQTRSLSTVQKEIHFLARLLRENGRPIEKPGPKRGRRTLVRALTLDECRRLLAVTPDHCRTLYLTLLLTGARPTELIPSSRAHHRPLLKTEVDFADNTVLIRTAKGHRGEPTRPRRIPIPEELADLLAQQIAANPGPYVFPTLLNPARTFKAALARAGIEKTTPDGTLLLHSFRHTYGTLQAAHGLQANLLSGVMGHARPSTTQRYIDQAQTLAPVLAVPLAILLQKQDTPDQAKIEDGTQKGTQEKDKPAEKAG